jgi:hypothetical protein
VSGYLSDIIQRNALPAAGQAPSPLLAPDTGLPGAFWRASDSAAPELGETWNETALYPQTQPNPPSSDLGMLRREDSSRAGTLQPPAPTYIERHLVRSSAPPAASERPMQQGLPPTQSGDAPAMIRERLEASNYSILPANSETLQSLRSEPEKRPVSPVPAVTPVGRRTSSKAAEMIRPAGDPPLITPLSPAAHTVPLVLPEKKSSATPKLVIGKLTVEIVDPAPKVQTVPRQTTSQPAAQEPKPFRPYNKLTFGLGQM